MVEEKPTKINTQGPRLKDVFGATSYMMMDGGTSHVTTKVYDVTSRMMTEVGGGASSTMKVCGATESILINSIIYYLCGYETVHFEAKITALDEGVMWSYQS